MRGEIPLTYHPNFNAHHINFGRSPAGIAGAHVAYGSMVQRTFMGLTLGHAINRAMRWYRLHGKHIDGTADQYLPRPHKHWTFTSSQGNQLL